MTHHDKARELVERLRRQKTTDEMERYEVINADFEGAYDLLVRDCREAADLITAQAEALEYAEAKDTPDALTPQIKKACQAPGYWSIYAQALELVSNRYSKSALVHLAAFLMMREQSLAEENQRLREALNAERALSDRMASALDYVDDYCLSYPDLGILSAVVQPAIQRHAAARAALSSTGEKG